MSYEDNGGPALNKCSKCDLKALRRQGHQWLCAMHYRFGQMRAGAKRHGKFVPSYIQLCEMVNAANTCRDCGIPMNWLAIENNTTVATLQHYRDGSLAIVCRSCNTRHAFMPSDSFRNLPAGHKYCPHCAIAKPFNEFSVDRGRSGPMKLKSWCKDCSSIAHRKWRNEQAMIEARKS